MHNLPYGSTKGALDRLVVAAARELQDLRLTANVVNPGPVDTGWMDDALREQVRAATPRGRGGRPQDTASLVSFLLSEDGGSLEFAYWVDQHAPRPPTRSRRPG